MKLVNIAKEGLQIMRDNGWQSLLIEVFSFYITHDIEILNIEETCDVRGDHNVRLKKLQIYIIIMLICVGSWIGIIQNGSITQPMI